MDQILQKIDKVIDFKNIFEEKVKGEWRNISLSFI